MSRNTSVMISRLLDDLGYSRDMVKSRQKAYATANSNAIDELFNQEICGSKREGLSLPIENDFDKMIVFNQLECRDVFDDISINNCKIKFQLVRFDSTAPGYTLLKYVSLDLSALPEGVCDNLVKVDKHYFLSSDGWKQSQKEILQQFFSIPGNNGFVTVCRDCRGPSCPYRDPMGLTNSDEVLAIRYHSPELISSWRNRRRLHNWPSPELIATVSSLEAHVVPVGYKDSRLHFLEWRICFTKGEIRLIESLNDCQTKLIILLKMIAKHVLQPISKEISSYVMKNLVLWMAEKHPSGIFVEHKLMTLLKHSMKLLKRCIEYKELPSFMIEERNLFADRLSDSEIVTLVETIDVLLGDGPAMLLRCPKIRQGLIMFYQFPDQFCLLSETRRCIVPIFEQMIVAQTKRFVEMMKYDHTTTFREIFNNIFSHEFFPEQMSTIGDILTSVINSLECGVEMDTLCTKCYLYLLS